MPRIIIADDDPDLRDILRTILESAGFEVNDFENGRDALEGIRAQQPDLVIVDYMMPYMKGPEVCAAVKSDMLLRHVPVLLLTGKSEVQDKVEGINAGADDYLIKPFEPQELLARVRMVLRRTERELEANPLTRLPGNTSIQAELERRLASQEQGLAVCYIDLDHFKAFNDHYGFQRGDAAIRRTAEVLLSASKDAGAPEPFLGHIGGDDFIMITTEPNAEDLCRSIIAKFDAAVPALYDEEDRKRGWIEHTDRKGNPMRVPLLTVSIALVSSKDQPLKHPGQIAQIGAELKAYAKRFEESNFVRDRRKN